MEVSIRSVRAADKDALADLWMAFMREQSAADNRLDVADDALERWTNDFESWIEDETVRFLIAEAGDEIAGFVFANRWGPPPIYKESEEVYLNEIYVKSGFRGEGIARKLVAALSEWAEEVGAERIRMSALAQNESARQLWEALGAEAYSIQYTLPIQSDEEAEASRENPPLGFV